MDFRVRLTVFASMIMAFTMAYSHQAMATEAPRCELIFDVGGEAPKITPATPTTQASDILVERGSLNLDLAAIQAITRVEMSFVLGLRTTRPLHAVMNEALRTPAKANLLAFLFEGLTEVNKKRFAEVTGYQFKDGKWVKVSDKIIKLGKKEAEELRADIDLQTAHLKNSFMKVLDIKDEQTFNPSEYFTLRSMQPDHVQFYLRQQIAILGEKFGTKLDSIVFDVHSRLELERLLRTNSAQHYFAIQASWMIDFSKPGLAYAYNPKTPLSYWVRVINALHGKSYTVEDLVASASHFEERVIEILIAYSEKQKRLKDRQEEEEIRKLIASEADKSKSSLAAQSAAMSLPQASHGNQLQQIVTVHEQKLAQASTEQGKAQVASSLKVERLNSLLKSEHKFSSRHHKQASFTIDIIDPKEFNSVFKPGSTGFEILNKYPEELVARLTRVVGSYFGNGQDLLPRDGHSSNLHHGIFSIYVSSYRILVTAKKVSEQNGVLKAKLVVLAAYSKYQISANGRTQEHHYELADARLKALNNKD